MAFLELSMVTSAIVSMSLEAAANKLGRREAIIRVLHQLNIDTEPPPDDFGAIYCYTLVEYGVFKPEPILNFFRNDFVREAFQRAFYAGDSSILEHEADSIIEWNNETHGLGQIDYDFRRELATFLEVFNVVVNGTRTPSEVKRDHSIDELHKKIDLLLQAKEEDGNHRTPTTESKHLTSRLDLTTYTKHLLATFAEWQARYTPLFAQYREFELYVSRTAPLEEQKKIPVLQIPELSPVVVILGESGIGKTTAFWKLILDHCNRLARQENCHIPVFVALRNWSPEYSLRKLIDNQLAHISAISDVIESELQRGNYLILVDGLNELPQGYEQRDAARRDLQNFLHRYSNNRYVFTCRTPDYDPKFLELDPNHPLPSFEIQQLEREQIEEYVRRHFGEDEPRANDLLTKLDLQNDKQWSNQSSFIHLARIPLLLQLIILEYSRTGYIPTNKAKILHALISHMVERDKVRYVVHLSIDGKTRLLGRLSYESILNRYYLSIPENLAKTLFTQILRDLRNEGLAPSDLLVEDIWQAILSNNLLAVQHTPWLAFNIVGWLHQLVFDYFLANEIVRIVVIPKRDDIVRLKGSLFKFPEVWSQPFQLALALVDPSQGAILLDSLFRANEELAKAAFDGQTDADADELAHALVQRLCELEEWNVLMKVALTIPYIPMLEGLTHAFQMVVEGLKKGHIAEVVSRLVRENYGSDIAERGIDFLEAWISSRNEIVRFHAALGLWERDRGRAASVLRALRKRGTQRIRTMVQEKMDEWGLE